MKLKSNIDKLKILTDTLIDRDFVRSKVIDLFDKFCCDFPVEMNAWIVEKDLSITSRKGSGAILGKEGRQKLDDIFTGEVRDKNIMMHKKAFSGESQVYILEFDEKIFLTKVMPASKSNDIVFGFSLDVTSFVNISEALSAHCDNMDETACELVRKVKEDNLYKIIKRSS